MAEIQGRFSLPRLWPPQAKCKRLHRGYNRVETVVSLFSRRPLTIVVVLATFLQPAPAAEPTCKVIDLMPEFWSVVRATRDQSPEQQVKAFRAALVDPHASVFGRTGLGFDSAAHLDSAILKSLADARRDEGSMRVMINFLETRFPSYLHAFREAFPDFRCDFTVYVTPSLNRLDGAGRVVDNQPSLIFGADAIAAEHSPADLKIFVDHELFHRYHSQVAGFSDDKAQQEVIWRALWAEGLATYVSIKLNPPASMQDALFVPKDLVKRSQPLLSGLIVDLQPKLDQVDPDFFSEFFLYHGPAATPPSRVGYYIAALVAEDMARHHSLSALAHMQAGAVRTELSGALADIAHRSAQPGNSPSPAPGNGLDGAHRGYNRVETGPGPSMFP